MKPVCWGSMVNTQGITCDPDLIMRRFEHGDNVLLSCKAHATLFYSNITVRYHHPRCYHMTTNMLDTFRCPAGASFWVSYPDGKNDYPTCSEHLADACKLGTSDPIVRAIP